MTEIWSQRGRVDVAGAAPDNTPPALALVSAHRLAGVEIDTWRTADGQFVVGHDRDTLAGAVDGLVRAAIPELPGLADVLDAAALITVNVELKVSPNLTADDAAALGEALTGWVASRSSGPPLVIASFSRAAADAVVAAAPHLRVSLICSELPDQDGLGALAAGGYWGVHTAGGRLDAAGVQVIHAACLAAVAWTVNDAGSAARLAGAGLDAVITDVPLALQQRIGG